MGKALVIKNVDFSTNKLTTVDLEDDVPCTGITLSANSLSFNKIGNTSALTVSVTPFDCTDAVIWSTSNSDVATVQGGTVTAVGVGTAVITATCGHYSDSCAVTVTHVLAHDDLWPVNGYGAIGANLEADPPKNYVYEQANVRYRLYLDESVYTDNPTGKYRALADKATTLPGYYQNGIEIPTGATQLVITVPTNAHTFAIAWQNNLLESGYFTDRVSFASVTQWDQSVSVDSISTYTVDLSLLPSGTNSLVISVITAPNTTASEILGNDIVFTFS